MSYKRKPVWRFVRQVAKRVRVKPRDARVKITLTREESFSLADIKLERGDGLDRRWNLAVAQRDGLGVDVPQSNYPYECGDQRD